MFSSLPPEQHIPSAWHGADMAQRQNEWLAELEANDIAELEKAAENWLGLGQDLVTLTSQAFPLPTFSAKLTQLREELINGRGFGVLRGLPTHRYTQQEAETIFYGLGSHLGNARQQNAKGHMMGHVRDLGVSSKDPNVRVYQTNERQTFHSDSTDVVGLLCLKTAQKGGLSLLVSSTTIFNEMRRLRPDLLELLLQPIATDRRGEVPEGMLPYYLIPIFNYYQGYLTGIYQRQYIDSAQRFEEAPRLTPKHVEALDLLDSLANEPRLNFSMKLEPGDMQFVYNHALLHDRTAFEDWPDDSQKRHLLRLWLAIPGDRPLPDCFAARFGSVESGNRGGVGI